MLSFYKEEKKFLISVDCIILGFKENKLHVLLMKRKFEPLKGQRSLMGAFVRDNESISDTVRRAVHEYTGLEDVYMEQVGVYSNPKRDVGERVISVACYALIDMKLFDESLCKQYDGEWAELYDVDDLVLDHNLMLKDTLKVLRSKASIHPVGFNLLPEKFTLPQLQLLYEAIYDTNFDKRNFRKKILDMDILEKLLEKDKSSSKRGAFYYKFDKEKYDKKSESGYYFSL